MPNMAKTPMQQLECMPLALNIASYPFSTRQAKEIRFLAKLGTNRMFVIVNRVLPLSDLTIACTEPCPSTGRAELSPSRT